MKVGANLSHQSLFIRSGTPKSNILNKNFLRTGDYCLDHVDDPFQRSAGRLLGRRLCTMRLPVPGRRVQSSDWRISNGSSLSRLPKAILVRWAARSPTRCQTFGLSSRMLYSGQYSLRPRRYCRTRSYSHVLWGKYHEADFCDECATSTLRRSACPTKLAKQNLRKIQKSSN